jgi:hypothetical protein
VRVQYQCTVLKAMPYTYINTYLLGVKVFSLLGLQEVNGSPSVPGGHVQVGLWFDTEQIALELQGFS